MFKKYDLNQSGFVNATEFKQTLKQARCELNENEMYFLMRVLDTDLSGSLSYNKFINEIIKPLTLN